MGFEHENEMVELLKSLALNDDLNEMDKDDMITLYWRGLEFLLQFGATDEQRKLCIESLKTLVEKLLKESLPEESQTSAIQQVEEEMDDLPLMRTSSSSEGSRGAEHLELALYLSRIAPDVKDKTLISWWTAQEDLPRMRKLALKFLIVPATSATPERTWSRAKQVLTDLRSCMSPATFAMTMFLGCNEEWMEMW